MIDKNYDLRNSRSIFELLDDVRMRQGSEAAQQLSFQMVGGVIGFLFQAYGEEKAKGVMLAVATELDGAVIARQQLTRKGHNLALQ